MAVIGIPQEVRENERRVSLLPQHIKKLSKQHTIIVHEDAGEKIGVTFDDYYRSGAQIAATNKEVYSEAEYIVKVSEPTGAEINLIEDHHILFSHLHLGGNKKLANMLLDTGCTAYAYETLVIDGKRPILAPISAIAGKLAVNFAAEALLAKGILLDSFSGDFEAEGARVLIIGAGVAGFHAAKAAYNRGAMVTVLDIDKEALRKVKTNFQNALVGECTKENMLKCIPRADLVISAVAAAGGEAPKVISKEILDEAHKGTVFFDLNIEDGGTIHDIKPTSLNKKFYGKDGLIFSAIPNMTSAVAKTSSVLLSEKVSGYIPALVEGKLPEGALNIKSGKIINNSAIPS